MRLRDSRDVCAAALALARATAVGIYRSIRIRRSVGPEIERGTRELSVSEKLRTVRSESGLSAAKVLQPLDQVLGMSGHRGSSLKSSSCLKDLRSFAPHATLGSFRRLDLSFALLTRTSCSFRYLDHSDDEFF